MPEQILAAHLNFQLGWQVEFDENISALVHDLVVEMTDTELGDGVDACDLFEQVEKKNSCEDRVQVLDKVILFNVAVNPLLEGIKQSFDLVVLHHADELVENVELHLKMSRGFRKRQNQTFDASLLIFHQEHLVVVPDQNRQVEQLVVERVSEQGDNGVFSLLLLQHHVLKKQEDNLFGLVTHKHVDALFKVKQGLHLEQETQDLVFHLLDRRVSAKFTLKQRLEEVGGLDVLLQVHRHVLGLHRGRLPD